MSRTPAVLLLASLALAGCKHAATPTVGPEATQPRPAAPAPVDPATAGAITGIVHLSGVTPKPIPIDMSADPACALATTPNLTEQTVADHGRLANVYVYIKAGLPPSSATAATAPVVLDQKGCRYTPHVVAVQQGGAVEFRNSDPTMHNIHTMPRNAANSATDVSEPPMGQPQTQRFAAPETMIPVRCNNHPWMNAFLNVAPNPYFAVTGADGSFSIKNLPPGTYTLAAVQEKLGEQSIQVTIPAKATVPANFTFTAQ